MDRRTEPLVLCNFTFGNQTDRGILGGCSAMQGSCRTDHNHSFIQSKKKWSISSIASIAFDSESRSQIADQKPYCHKP
jgi:hypothetical protein